jgi:hypothetical protein
MLHFPRLLARGLLIHIPDPNAYCHRLTKQFGKHVIYRMISVLLFPTRTITENHPQSATEIKALWIGAHQKVDVSQGSAASNMPKS